MPFVCMYYLFIFVSVHSCFEYSCIGDLSVLACVDVLEYQISSNEYYCVRGNVKVIYGTLGMQDTINYFYCLQAVISNEKSLLLLASMFFDSIAFVSIVISMIFLSKPFSLFNMFYHYFYLYFALLFTRFALLTLNHNNILPRYKLKSIITTLFYFQCYPLQLFPFLFSLYSLA